MNVSSDSRWVIVPVNGSNMVEADAEEAAARRSRGLTAALVTVVVGMALLILPATSPLPFLGWYGLSSVLPAVLLVTYRPGPRSVSVALVAVIALLALGIWLRTSTDLEPFQRHHDGGVVATEAAAEMVRSGTNPYTADFTAALSPDHHTFEALNRPDLANPLVEHYPYLPAAFLIHVPLVAIGALAGDVYDVRIVYAAAVVAALVLVARGASEPWRRAAALAAIGGNLAIAAYLPWGANDAAAVSLVVISALIADRRPWIAGVLLAVAISMKALLVVALVPLGLVWFLRDRNRSLSALGVTMAVLVVTCLPYFIAAPHDFVDDTVRFNLGSTELNYPTSGIGLGALYPDVLGGPLLLAASVVLVVLAAGVGVWWVRRAPRPEIALFVAGVIVFAGLLPARSFQISYVPLFVLLWGPIWRLSVDEVMPSALAAGPGPGTNSRSLPSGRG